MRRLTAFLLTGCLATGLVLFAGAGLGERTAFAQSVEVGAGAAVALPADRRVNVRSAPEVQSGNIVASAAGGTLLIVQDAVERDGFPWYLVETLANATVPFRGWVRGDFLRSATLDGAAASTASQGRAQRDAGAARAPATNEPPEPLPYAQRTDWSRDIIRLFPAIAGCTAVNSAPPVTVIRAVARSRGFVEVMMSDSAGRRWDCVIGEEGGTPIRYDPLSGALFIRDRLATEPYFMVQEQRPALDPDCHRFERVFDPATSAHLGWLYYRTCP